MRNADRTARTRTALMDTAQALFAARGYADTPTDAILDGAGVKRGAMYHHFKDKADLFAAICERLSAQAAEAIMDATRQSPDAASALRDGSLAWLRFMLAGDARRLLVVEAPTVLGLERWHRMDGAHGFQLLRQGVTAVLAADAMAYAGDGEDLAIMLNGAMNALVLRDADPDTAASALLSLFSGLGLTAPHNPHDNKAADHPDDC